MRHLIYGCMAGPICCLSFCLKVAMAPVSVAYGGVEWREVLARGKC